MEKITEITRGYASAADRARAVAMMRRHGKNYFVFYRDTASVNALLFSHAEWVDRDLGKGAAYIDR